jgi:hypothetical protein
VIVDGAEALSGPSRRLRFSIAVHILSLLGALRDAEHTSETRNVYVGAGATMPALEATGKDQPCSQARLAKVIEDFKANVLAKKPVELAEGAEVRENMENTRVQSRAPA